MVPVIVLVGAIACALAALLARQLLASALWLAGTSALTAVLLYLLGAPEVAVIELSVGAGLVTVLFVFAINIAGHEIPETDPVVPRPLGYILSGASFGLLAVIILSRMDTVISFPITQKFVDIFWQHRSLDTLLQVALIFCGVMAVLSLLADRKEARAILRKGLK